MAEFWYNSSYHSSINSSPFKALYGMEPNFGALPNITLSTDSSAINLATELQAHTELLRAQLQRAQNRMKLKADKHRTEREFCW